ncbi:MAG: AAA family ATPase [Pseudomonadales bacterium]
MSFLQYGLSQADGFIVITGNAGTGKTTLVQTLLKDLDQTRMAVATLVRPNLDEEDLIKFVATEFGIWSHATSKADLLKDGVRVSAGNACRATCASDCGRSTEPAANVGKNCACCPIFRWTVSLCCRSFCWGSRNFGKHCCRKVSNNCVSG